MQKILSIVIKASQDFIRHTDEDLKDNAPILNNFYESISNVYIPLLRMIEKLE
jgi:1,4-alpha-glucan branching enzyme